MFLNVFIQIKHIHVSCIAFRNVSFNVNTHQLQTVYSSSGNMFETSIITRVKILIIFFSFPTAQKQNTLAVLRPYSLRIP